VKIVFFLLVAGTLTVTAQNALLEYPLVLHDAAGDSAVLWFGLDPAATDGIDASLHEEELPPSPPSKVFDARFIGDDIDLPQLGTGTYRDYRHGDRFFSGQTVHEIAFQTMDNSKLTIAWDLPENVTGYLIDFYGGTYLKKEMIGAGEVSISLVTVVDRARMTITYQTSTLTLQSPNGGEVLRIDDEVMIEWNSQFVEGDVMISLSRDNGGTFTKLAQVDNTGSFIWTVVGPPSDECWLKISDSSGLIVDESDASFSIQFADGIESTTPESFSVSPNYPNPFNPQTTIKFYTPNMMPVRAEIINAAGQLVRLLADQYFANGEHSLVWNGDDDSGRKAVAGIYFVRIIAGAERHVGKMILLP